MRSFPRRDALAHLAAWMTTPFVASLGCSRRSSREGTPSRTVSSPLARFEDTTPTASAPAPDLLAGFRVDTWKLEAPGFGTVHAAVLSPVASGDASQDRLPLLVALHGRGESLKSPPEGALGWVNDYAMPRAITRLRAPPLVPDDYLGFVTDDELARTNAELARRPFGGLVVACPYLPDLNPRSEREVSAYARAIVDDVLPRVRREAPVIASSRATGIDGVSHGGITALRVGFLRPDAFGAVGALQPALREADVAGLTELARAARARNPSLALRLTTSDDDSFREVTTSLSERFAKLGVSHESTRTPGPHDYAWNRGPGAITMLRFHDRVLARA
ncbi:MAG: esterase [Polyangiaceae bacterium]